jgi:hypothetical protein
MRKFLLFLGFSLVFVAGICQAYHPLLRPNTYWDVQYVNGPNICVYDFGERYYIQGDSTIAGENFKIIMAHPIRNVNPGPYCPPYAVDTTISLYSYFCLREDTADRRVYISTSTYINELFYDFSLGEGDTLKSEYASQGLILIVDSIRTITIYDGTQRKIFYLSNGEYYIEGIGSSQGFVSPICEAISGGGELECVNGNGIDLWGYNCGYGIYNIQEATRFSAFTLSPNPTSHTFSIHLPETFSNPETLELFNSLGQMVGRFDRVENVDISGYPSGLYFVVVTGEDGQRMTGRVVKE